MAKKKDYTVIYVSSAITLLVVLSLAIPQIREKIVWYYEKVKLWLSAMFDSSTAISGNNSEMKVISGGQLPLGLRNNNPGNIKINPANAWDGEVKNNTDGTFEQFTIMKYGMRAQLKLLKNYLIMGRVKLDDIIKIWSGADNHINYTKYVAEKMDVPTNWRVDSTRLSEVCKYMADFENGMHHGVPSVEQYQAVKEEFGL